MKVWLTNYRSWWVSPYTVIEKVMFWREIDRDELLVKWWHKKLEPICEAVSKLGTFLVGKRALVKVDYWDIWSLDDSLAQVILPCLIKLKESKCGHGLVDDADVPEELGIRSTQCKEKWNPDHGWDPNSESRYTWVLDEMIFAMHHIVNSDWEEIFYWSQENKHKFPEVVEMIGSGEYDYKGSQKVQERIQRGCELFGKYFRSLWT